MKIFVFETQDGLSGADYSEEFCKRQGRIVRTVTADHRRDIELVVRDDPMPRVRALAERSLKELVASTKPIPRPVDAGYVDMLKGRSFLGRARWLLTGR